MSQKNLVYTVAFDCDGQRLYGNLAKLLSSSILRSAFDCEVVIFHNGTTRLFQLERKSVTEVAIDLELPPVCDANANFLAIFEQRWSLKHRVSSILLNEFEWDRALFIDADCLVTGNLDELTTGDFDLAIYREPGRKITLPNFNCFLTDDEMNQMSLDGINSGVFCVDRAIAEHFFESWLEIEKRQENRSRWCTDQAALNRVVIDGGYRLKDLSDLISMPYYTDSNRWRQRNACITHWVGLSGYEKLKASFGLYSEMFLCDPSLTFFNLMEQ